MGFRSFFKSGWRRSRHRAADEIVARIASTRKLRKMAARSKDERIRLAAARRLNDVTLLRNLAVAATQDAVRLEAAIDVDNESSLTAIALKAWNIQLGQKAVRHIRNRLLLRRLSQSAQQDAIRLAAAFRLEDKDLLRRVARASRHFDVQWQIAHYLKDPCMLADIAMIKPGNRHLAPLRRLAHQAFKDQLDRCRQAKDHTQLLEVIQSSVNPAFKLEAFLRLPADHICPPVLESIAGLDLQYVPQELIHNMVTHISACGWQVAMAIDNAECRFCRGNGKLSLKCVTASDTWKNHDVFACPDCLGSGKIPIRLAVCSRPDGVAVTLKLPL